MLVAVLKQTMVECFRTGDKLVSTETRPVIKPELKPEVRIGWQLIDDSHPMHSKYLCYISCVYLFINTTAQIILQLKPQQIQRQH